jgi:hypothetical protein
MECLHYGRLSAALNAGKLLVAFGRNNKERLGANR